MNKENETMFDELSSLMSNFIKATVFFGLLFVTYKYILKPIWNKFGIILPSFPDLSKLPMAFNGLNTTNLLLSIIVGLLISIVINQIFGRGD